MALGGGGGGKASPDAVKAGEAFVDVWINDTRFMRGLDALSARVKRFGAGLSKLGLGAAAFGAAAIAPLAAITKSVADYGSSIQDAVDRTGATAEAISGLGFAAELSGSNLDGVVRGLTLMSKAAVAAANGGKEQANAFAAMGISAQEFMALDADQKFLTIARALEGINDETQKADLLFRLMGKSAVELAPLFANGVQGLEELLTKANQTGAVISGETAARSDQIGDSLDALTNGLKMTVFEIGAAFLGMSDAVSANENSFNEFFGTIREFIRENAGTVRSIALLAAGLLGLGVALAVAGAAITGFMAILGVLKGIVLGIIAIFTSPFTASIALIGAAIGGLTYAFIKFTDTGKEVASEASQAWASIAETATTAMDGITAAVAKGDLVSAFKIAWVAIKIIWQEGLLFLTKQWNRIKEFFIDGADNIATGIKLAFWDAIAWIMRAFSKAITFITRNAADLLDTVGATDTARAVRGVTGFSDEEINAGRDAIKRDIINRRMARQAERDASRKADEDAIAERIRELKEELTNLVNAVKGGTDGAQGDPLFSSGLGMFLDQIMQNRHLWYKGGGYKEDMVNTLGKAVRGAFGSRNYQGAFGIGPADKIQKDQLNTQKDILEELKGIHGKVGKPTFD